MKTINEWLNEPENEKEIMIICRICGKSKPSSEFYVCELKSFQHRCKECKKRGLR